MNSAKDICDNFHYIPDNFEKDLLLFSDSEVDEKKNKFILEAITRYTKNYERLSGALCK